jgi:lysophospholipase L1-like esterase
MGGAATGRGEGVVTRRGRVLAGLLVAAVAIEGSLQVAAFAAWWWYGRDHGGASRRDGDPGDRVVACVGDSFTYGIGASAATGAYPAQLERVLRERPDYVVVLVGTNDRWSDVEMERASPALDAIRAAADADAIPLVDLAPLFRERLATVAATDLYAPDGHLTDAGYGVVAEAVAARVLALETSRETRQRSTVRPRRDARAGREIPARDWGRNAGTYERVLVVNSPRGACAIEHEKHVRDDLGADLRVELGADRLLEKLQLLHPHGAVDRHAEEPAPDAHGARVERDGWADGFFPMGKDSVLAESFTHREALEEAAEYGAETLRF